MAHVDQNSSGKSNRYSVTCNNLDLSTARFDFSKMFDEHEDRFNLITLELTGDSCVDLFNFIIPQLISLKFEFGSDGQHSQYLKNLTSYSIYL